MVRPARGFITENGEFFESKTEADLAEAKAKLSLALEAIGMSVDETLAMIERMGPLIKVYLDAHHAHIPLARVQVEEETELPNPIRSAHHD